MNVKTLFLGFCLLLCASLGQAEDAKLAIVIDDIGYRAKEDSAIFRLSKEVSVAIIPVAPHAKSRAEQAFAQQRDILIHLPMEPQSRQPLEEGGLYVGTNQQQIDALITQAKALVPNAIGLNNHMGSRVTADSATMQKLMNALTQHKLSFLDSKTAGNSVAYLTAKNYGVRALERHIFLDDSDEYADVQRQFNAAIQYARRHGIAIMIGHPRKNSVAVLEKGIANLPRDIKLVSLRQLWNAQKPEAIEQTPEPVKPFIMLFPLEPASTSMPPFESVPLLRGLPKE